MPDLEVRKVENRGRGVFAGRRFAAGELIEAAPLLVIPAEQWADLERTSVGNYTFCYGEEDEHAALALGYGSLYNHSPNPSARYETDYPEARIRFLATREIRPGEEITIDYKVPLWFDPAPPLPPPPFPEVTVLLGDAGLPDETKRGGVFNPDDVELVDKLKATLAKLPDYHFRYEADHGGLLQRLREAPPAFVLNFCDEGFRNAPTMELHVPALLELLGIPYSGAGPACLAMCYDKQVARAIAADLGIPVPREVYLAPGALPEGELPPFPVLVKPNCGDGSFGITRDSVVHDRAALAAYVQRFHARWPERALLIQELLTGQEFTIALIGNPGAGFSFLPIVSPDYRALEPGLPRICGFESKEVPDNPYWEQIEYPMVVPEPELRGRLESYAARLFERLGCRDYARFDFRLDAEGALKLMDANPNPGYNFLGYMGNLAGIPYAEVLRMIIQAAQERVR